MSYKIDITLKAEFVRTDDSPEHQFEHLNICEIKRLQNEEDPTIEEINAHFLKNDNYIEYVVYIIQYVLQFSECIWNQEYKEQVDKVEELLKEVKKSKSKNYEKVSMEYEKLYNNPIYDEKVLKSISYLGNGKMNFTVYTNDEEASLLIDDFIERKKKLYKLQMYVVDQIKEDSLEDGPYESDPQDSPFIYESRKVPGFALGEFDHRNDLLEVRVEKL
jgi:hypothetical protein